MLGLPDQHKILSSLSGSIDATEALAKAITKLAEATDRQTDALNVLNKRTTSTQKAQGW